MKKNKLLLLLAVILIACGGGGGEGDMPEVHKDYLSVPPNMSLLGDGESQNLQVDANCSWAISVDVDWLTVNPMSGTNRQNVTITAGKNNSGSVRTAVLTVSGGSMTRRVTVTQAKASVEPEVPEELTLSVNTSAMEFGRQGGTQSFMITSNTNWTITCPEWCTLSTSSGKGDATISVTAGGNPTTEPRTGKVVLTGEGVDAVEISLMQEQGEAESHQPASGDNQPPGW